MIRSRDRLQDHVCTGPGLCPHDACRKNREEEEAWQYDRMAWEEEDRTREEAKDG